jgi:Cu+-exporting ATPase
VRPDARDAVAELHRRGARVVLLTGDRRGTAEAIAREIGADDVIAEQLPWDKVEFVKKLRAEGSRVAMVGDGINDAPALAASHLGIAIGRGEHIAAEAADVILLRPRLAAIHETIDLARATRRVVRENLVWAFGYNVLGIPLAAGAFYPWTGWLLSPVFASAAMALSSVSVVVNSLRLARTTENPRRTSRP